MKIKCDVCQTEYNLPDVSVGHVRCAVCGNVWSVSRAGRRNHLLVFFASLCALLAATVFAVAVIVTSRRDNPEKQPVVATVLNVKPITESDGTTKLVVNGNVTNRSDDIYGFPDLAIVLHGADGSVIARRRFMPSSTLLDAGQSVDFSHTVTGNISGVRRVSVELLDSEQSKAEK